MDIPAKRTTRRTTNAQNKAKVTLKEVAVAAGVSMMTVSNVLNNRTNVGAEIRVLVQKKIKELGYVPNRAAQELAGVVRPRFGLLYPSVLNPFIGSVVIGSLNAAARMNADISIQLAQPNDPEALKSTIHRMEESGIEGFLFPSPIAEAVVQGMMLHALQMQVPAVAIAPGLRIPGMTSVRSDEQQAAFELVTMLLDLGHTKIGHLSGPDTQSASIARYQGYCAALKARGIEPSPELVVKTPFKFQEGVKAADVLLDQEPRVTAIFAGNDTLAASVLAAAHRRGISVPEALSVVGYDDTAIAEQVLPALTTVHQDASAMTERAVEVLAQNVKEWRIDPSIHSVREVLLPYQIVNRASVARVPVGSNR